jgi:hypothetical protein
MSSPSTWRAGIATLSAAHLDDSQVAAIILDSSSQVAAIIDSSSQVAAIIDSSRPEAIDGHAPLQDHRYSGQRHKRGHDLDGL